MPRAVAYTLVIFILAGCGGNPRAPVEDRNSPASSAKPAVMSSRSAASPGEYSVRRGDTLYSIAWRHGFDFKALAAANGIPAPYTIYPGQTLRLRAAPVPDKSPPRAEVSRDRSPPATPGPAPQPTPKPAPKPVSSSAPPPGQEKPTPVTKGSSASAKKEAPAQNPPPAPTGPVARWRWPAEGPVIRGFSATVHKGIDIGGNRGEAVRAVADGVVVYAGTGIVGFGELLIVKHNDTYLSAYGHNDRLLVGEGSVLRAGQKIAEKGSSGTDNVKLHFEIRKNGKPIDPLRLLPKK